MSSKLLTAPEREGKTFNVAIRILGAVAIFQIFLATWSVLIRFKGEEINPGNGPSFPVRFALDALESAAVTDGSAFLPEVFAARPGPSSPPPTPLLATLSGEGTDTSNPGKAAPSPPGQRILLAQNQPPPSPPSAAAPLPANLLAHRISIPEVEDLVKRALILREQGDCQGALEALRQADGKLSSHPRILAEIATTLQQMGLDTKAAPYWERVHQMRPEGAGAYWDLADMALKGQVLDEASSLATYLQITRHSVRTQPATDGTQRVVLSIHIGSAPKETISGNEMYLNVLFYDAVNDTTFEPTVADTKPIYLTQPYDWKDGSDEIIEVEYFLPKLSAEQQATLGQRRYFGYVVELFYKDFLQDIVANPRKLARLGSSASRAARPIRQNLPQPAASPAASPAATPPTP